MAEPKFQFYEYVRVRADNPALAEIHGQRGAVLGRSEDDEGGYGYAVSIERDGICWSVEEADLEATGEFGTRADFYGDESIRVRVDAEGRGTLAD
ncbi:Imm31 family immunity protein [Arenimonas sp. GDDSR-1]|uniref:Imm31 family immunity protein n=1 Tax=Arenimonas sp. GDDSR-1 TaxID=2950125 RepID=UPI00262EA87E|nr:Imm31 family immunity protein [Arenimonas sp. GDDSR-1]